MAEGVHRGFRAGAEALRDGEDHPRGAEREKSLAGLGEAEPDRARRIVAAARGDDDPHPHPPAPGKLGPEHARGRASLKQAGDVGEIEPGCGEQAFRPAPRPDIEPGGAGGIGAVGRLLAGQHQAEIVLGQQHAPDAGEDLGLMPAHPEELGRGEARHDAVAGDRPRLRHRRLERRTLSRAPPVIPEDRRAQRPVRRIEQHRPVHLPGKPDGAHRGERPGRFGGEPVERGEERSRPVLGALFRPERAGMGEGERRPALGRDTALLVEEKGLEFGRAEIEAEKHASLPRPLFPPRLSAQPWPCRALASRRRACRIHSV